VQDRERASGPPRRKGRKDSRKDGLLTTGDMARMSNSTLRTVRFYEEEDILHPVQRSEGGHRLFAPEELDKLLLVTDLRAAGLSLDEIKSILVLRQTSKSGVQASRRASEFLKEQTEAMRRKITVLQRLQEDFAVASEVFAGCKHCENEEASPSRCQVCGIPNKPAVLPRAVRVLWNMGGSS
jgi:DNA-binding transcriptional MerR regulator